MPSKVLNCSAFKRAFFVFVLKLLHKRLHLGGLCRLGYIRICTACGRKAKLGCVYLDRDLELVLNNSVPSRTLFGWRLSSGLSLYVKCLILFLCLQWKRPNQTQQGSQGEQGESAINQCLWHFHCFRLQTRSYKTIQQSMRKIQYGMAAGRVSLSPRFTSGAGQV